MMSHYFSRFPAFKNWYVDRLPYASPVIKYSCLYQEGNRG